MNSKKLIDVYPFFTSGEGIFKFINLDFLQDYNDIDLDILFFTTYGKKPINALVEYFLLGGDVLLEPQREKIGELITMKYGKNWEHYYNVFSAEYKPISNYDMVENETINGEEIGTENENITNTLNIDETETANASNESESDLNTFAFNSTSSVPTDKNLVNNTSNATNERSGINTNTNIGSKNTNNEKQQIRELTRSGNIGVTTSQQMLESEIELWKWNFLQSIFEDISSFLSLWIY